MLLDYENEMIIDMYNGSTLLISGKGMGIEKIIYSFLKLYCIEDVLVLVINSSMEESKYYLEKLKQDNVPHEPIHITAECLTKTHENIYKRGGLIFISSQILIVDYLMGRIPGALVSGVLVLKGHKVTEACQEAFALRLFKESNPNGFVKAFSDNSLGLSSGFSTLDRVMMNLHVREVYLWPRFSLSVVTTLNNCKPNIHEIMLEITHHSTSCQISLLDIIKELLNELKILNPFIDSDELTVENAMTNLFDRTVRIYFEPIWSQISRQSRQLIHEIRDMRRLTYILIEQDPVSFFIVLDTMRSNALSGKSNWITLRAANQLFNSAKLRLFKNVNVDWRKIVPANELNIEIPPKWKEFIDILKRIKEKQPKEDIRKTLVIVGKEFTALLLAKLSITGAKNVLNESLRKHLNIKTGKVTKTKILKPTSSTLPEETEEFQGIVIENSCYIVEDSKIIIHFMSEGISENYISSPIYKLHYIIRKYDPRRIILFDPRMSAVREIENYQAELMCSDKPDIISIYFMMYTNSIEEQKYLTTLRKEKEAFEYLIKSKASLILPEMCYDVQKSVYGTSSRIGGSDNIVANVIVDMREFRSELPALLHKKGFKIEPLTINVGDYILAPHICVERKSVSDFIGSLHNGRLYSQCASMTRYYPLSILLIEFSSSMSISSNHKNTFSLFIGNNEISKQVTINDIISKLTLLTIHFPKLRILWSHNPYATVELFKDLKFDRPEPSKEKLPTSDGSLYSEENKLNEDVVDTLLKIPGITWKNHGMFLSRINNFHDLLRFTEDDIYGIIQNKNIANQIYSFLHQSKKDLFLSVNLESNNKNFKKPRFDLLKKNKV